MRSKLREELNLVRHGAKYVLNVAETDRFQSSVTKKGYQINYKFKSSSLYLLVCKTCMKHYISKRVTDFGFYGTITKTAIKVFKRWNMQRHILHFL